MSDVTASEVICHIGVGSNLQDPLSQCKAAMNGLRAIPGIELKKVSSLYQSEPMGPTDQPQYLNAVVELNTVLAPMPLLDALQAIEQQHGRIRNRRWGERTLDLDLLLYGNSIINTPRLIVPHPGITERSFVLVPLLEIAPQIQIPGRGKAAEFLDTAPDLAIARYVDKNNPGESSEA